MKRVSNSVMELVNSDDPDITKPREKCGVAAVWTSNNLAPQIIRRAEVALQHRGQESAGIAIFTPKRDIKIHIGMGMVAQVLSDELISSLGPSNVAIAHNRYSTTGGSSLMNAHPVSSKHKNYQLAVAHNGNIPDTSYLKKHVKNHPKADSDTALMAVLLVEQRSKYNSWKETFANVLPEVKGAYSLTVLTEEGNIYGIRDPFGIRPLCIGKLDNGFVIASESVALDAVGASFIREIQRGEILKIDQKGNLTSTFFGEPKRQRICLFEHIYFSRPDSFINGRRIKSFREESGKLLGKRLKKMGIKLDLVIPIFNSGYFAARGTAQELGLPLVDAVVTSSYFGRTFINPGHETRINAVFGKHSIIPDEIVGKNVVFVDDSAVRFNTSAVLGRGLREAGAKKIYAALASPPIINQCDLGISMRTKEELPAALYEKESLEVIEKKMAELIKVDGVIYLPLEDTCQASGGTEDDFYCYPFGGEHPIRGSQESYPRNSKFEIRNSKLRTIILTPAKSGVLEDINKQIKSGGLDLEVAGIVANEVDLLKLTHKTDPNLVLVLNYPKEISSEGLKELEKSKVVVVKAAQVLINGSDPKMVITSKGAVPKLSEKDAPIIAFEEDLPVWGVSIFQIGHSLKNSHKSVILKEEVKKSSDDNLNSYLKKIEDAENRVVLTGLKRVAHIYKSGIELSGGEFLW